MLTSQEFKDKFKPGTKWIYVNDDISNGMKRGNIITIKLVNDNNAYFHFNGCEYNFIPRYYAHYVVPYTDNMDDMVRRNATIYKHIDAMMQSYTESIREAGGDVKYFLDNMDTMTVTEMFKSLAQNGIRFYFDEKEVKKC